LRERLQPVHERLSTVIIENLPWQICIERYDRPTTVMYIDPPYPGNKCNYAHNMRNWDDHQSLADRLGLTRCKWILSPYDTPEIRRLFSRYHITPVQAFSGMRVKKSRSERALNKKVLITNFLPSENSLYASESHQIKLLLERDVDID
jgi:DNA adenine methylase